MVAVESRPEIAYIETVTSVLVDRTAVVGALHGVGYIISMQRGVPAACSGRGARRRRLYTAL